MTYDPKYKGPAKAGSFMGEMDTSSPATGSLSNRTIADDFNGGLDVVVQHDCYFHIERMDFNCFWFCVNDRHFELYIKWRWFRPILKLSEV